MSIFSITAYFIISIIGSLSTFQISKKIENILSSTGITVVGSLIIILISKIFPFDCDTYLYCLYGASFVGMSDAKKFSKTNILIASLFYSLFYIFITPLLGGLGGALGFTAFLSVIKSLILKKTKA